MTFATPTRASDQVAALTGVTPAAVDPGQPMRLALAPQPEQEPIRTAAVEPAPAFAAAPQMVEQSVPEQAAFSPPEPVFLAAADPVPVAAADIVPVVPAPAFEAPKPQAKAKRVAAKAKATEPGLSPRAASLMHKANFPKLARGDSKSVVQLGAYNSRNFVGTAWGNLAKKYPALRGYTPSSARFESNKGTVYRLSVQGFASDGDARDFCEALQQAGGKCFVRTVAGDAPVRLAAL